MSLRYSDKFLSKFDRYFLVPNNLTGGVINRKGYKIKRFAKSFFKSREAYNHLLLSKIFYQAFKKYRFILIYQLDALVFSDKLLYWCNQGYDYIAAPWFDTKIGHLTNKKGSPISGGNGGLSLRNVSSCLKVLSKAGKNHIRSSDNKWVQKFWLFWAIITGMSHKIWLNAPPTDYPYNEDGFWSLEAPKYLPNYRVAPPKESLAFAFEKFPRKSFELNHRKLPFGCHAWERYDKDFWLSKIPNLNNQV